MYQLWNHGKITGEYYSLPEAIDKITEGREIEDAISFYSRVDSHDYFLLETKKGKKMDIAVLLKTGSETAASIERLNAIRLRRQKENYKAYTFRLSKSSDYSLISFLSTKANANEYVKNLIRADFEKLLYPAVDDGTAIYATSAVRRLMVILDITPYAFATESFYRLYPQAKYGIIIDVRDGKYYVHHADEPDDVKLDYRPIA